MPTIAEQLNQLEQDREELVDNLETKGITGLSGDETFTELVPEVLNIPSGSSRDWSEIGYAGEPEAIQDGFDYAKQVAQNWTSESRFYGDTNILFAPFVDTSERTTFRYFAYQCYKLVTIPLLNTNNVTNFANAFEGCSALEEIPLFNTQNVTTFNSSFSSCYSLKKFPILNTSKVTNFYNMFKNVGNLNDDSVDNVLKMCINATTYNQSAETKTLAHLGFTKTNYPVARIQALSNYQDFINAGWTIGYS